MSMFRRFGLAVVVLAVAGGVKVGFCGSFCDAWSGQADFGMYGLCFSPYKDGNGPPDYVPVEQIRERLEIVAPYTEWVRSYSATNGLEEIPFEARKLGLKVAMGTWLRDSYEAEIDNLVTKAQAGFVDIAVVGNEELISQAFDANELIDIISDVRQRFQEANCPNDILVGIAEPFGTWANRQAGSLFKRDANGVLVNGEVIESVDIVLLNIYPFFEDVHIRDAEAKLDEMYREAVAAVHEVDANMKVVISESGWPTEGKDWGVAKSSPANAARYFYQAQCWAARNDVKMFYFAAFDEQWKPPPEYEAHWGIWDSNGVIKGSFLPEHVFCEDFDPWANTFCAYTDEKYSATEPNLLGPDGDSDGQFLRVLYDNEKSHFSSAAFDRTAEGPFCRIITEFDFRMFGTGNGGDGFAFILFSTSWRAGSSGCVESGGFVEQPSLPGTFAVGFEICDAWPCSGSDSANRIYISWDKQWYPDGGPIEVNDVDLDSGEFHRVRIELTCAAGDTGLVSVLITPDVYDPNHSAAVTVAENVIIGDLNHPYKPYENRVEFAGRNGGKTTNADIDNIYVSYKTEFCGYFLEGDINGDCRVNLFDLASLANNWLVNCNSSPVNDECMPK